MYALSKRSRLNLSHVSADLSIVAFRAIQITKVDFAIIEGVRTVERQKELFESGASKTMNSRHIAETREDKLGHAIDVAAYVGGGIRWDWPLYIKITNAFQRASEELQIPIDCGIDWTSFPDGGHIQLPWTEYQ